MAKKRIPKKDIDSINDKLHRTLEVKKQIKIEVEKRVLKIRDEFIESVKEHPVTKEIKAGPSATNISGTLSGVRGNLFGFIGFEEGSDPIGQLLEVLMKYDIKVYSKKGKTSLKITIPTPDEVYAATPLPWAEGRSWVRSVETGLSGLGKFISESRRNSRSGAGIQLKNKIRGARFKRVSYITKLLNDYAAKIENIKSI